MSRSATSSIGSPEALHPITRQIIDGGAKPLAADAFAAYYRLKELRRVDAGCMAARSTC